MTDAIEYRFVCGIDPGLTGAVCMLDIDSGEVFLHDMPVVPKSVGKGNQLSAHGLADVLAQYAHDTIARCYVEAVTAMPGQGVTSMFGFGRTAGVIDGVLAALRIPTEYVLPTRWKKALGLTKTEKDVARTHAINLYPKLSASLARKSDIGRADALLIAHFGKAQLGDTPTTSEGGQP